MDSRSIIAKAKNETQQIYVPQEIYKNIWYFYKEKKIYVQWEYSTQWNKERISLYRMLSRCLCAIINIISSLFNSSDLCLDQSKNGKSEKTDLITLPAKKKKKRIRSTLNKGSKTCSFASSLSSLTLALSFRVALFINRK